MSTTSDSENQQAAIYRRLHPKAYLERFLVEKFRPDGRELDEWRDISVNVGESMQKPSALLILIIFLPLGSISTTDGSALVRLGNTTIICGIKAEIAEPELDRPEDGFLGMKQLSFTENITHLDSRLPSSKSWLTSYLFAKI